jgi:hypothetical protein
MGNLNGVSKWSNLIASEFVGFALVGFTVFESGTGSSFGSFGSFGSCCMFEP